MSDKLLKKYRVVVWSTGWIGRIAIETIHRRPDLELVGVWVHSAEKVGKDAGELAGIGKIGVIATHDSDALLALKPDCICHCTTTPERDTAAVAEMAKMLAAGCNVVTSTIAGLVFPEAYSPKSTAVLQKAAEEGGSTLYASGVEPGFAGDHLPLTLLTMSTKVRSVRAQEIFLYDKYPTAHTMFELFGFGKPMDFQPILAMPGIQSITWAPPIRMVASALGVTLDEVRETYEKQVTPRRLEVAAGVIEAGTVGAVRFETIGVVDGRDAIIIEHINRMAPDLAPEWAQAERDGTYRVIIEGTPDMQCTLTLGQPETASDDGMLATAMRIVNAIPWVCDAPPGLTDSLKLPLTLPRYVF